MPHDVLISYSSKDKLQADAICNRLEAQGIRCWIAPRDVPLGTEYADSIVDAIESAKVMVLVFSSNANESNQVRREVERAVSKGITIVPVRIDDSQMSKSFELYVSSMHWLDAMTPPLERHIDKLARDLNALLAKDGKGASPSSAPAQVPRPAVDPESLSTATASSSGSNWSSSRVALIGGLAVVAILIALWALKPSQSGPLTSDPNQPVVSESNPAAPPSGCYWLNANSRWELNGQVASKEACFDLDSCSGGNGSSGGGCYKWSAGPDAVAEAWPGAASEAACYWLGSDNQWELAQQVPTEAKCFELDSCSGGLGGSGGGCYKWSTGPDAAALAWSAGTAQDRNSLAPAGD